MGKNRFSEFKALLRDQREQTIEELRSKIAASAEGVGSAGHAKVTDEDGLPDAAAEMEFALLVRESRELQDIEAALKRIDEGSYGNCIGCGEAIGHARLRAYPGAARCLRCQQVYEYAHRPARGAGA